MGLISTYYGTAWAYPIAIFEKPLVVRYSRPLMKTEEELLDTYFVTISARDRMIQLGIFHRIYYMPFRLFRMRKQDSAVCHKCHGGEGIFLHMLWNCEKIRPFWSNVTHFITTNFDLPNMCRPKWCILIVTEMERFKFIHSTFLTVLC